MGNLSPAANILKTLETSSSAGMFARDTFGCLGAKLAVSRSNEERKEITFAELSESVLFYFSAPAIAKLTSDKFAKSFDIGKNLIKEPLNNIKNISQDRLKNVKLAKFGQISATFGIILPLIYAIAPMRNILTYQDSGKDEFVSVVGLKKDEKNKEEKNKKQEIKSLTAKTLGTAAGMLALTGTVLAAAKNDNVYSKIEPAIDTIIKHLDFTKSRDLTLKHYGALIYPVSIASYFAASRDKYEKEENARRFSITVPLMFFGEKLIEKPIYKGFDKIFNTKVLENSKIKSYKEILKLSENMQKQYLKSKNCAYGLTFFTNTIAIAAAVGMLNRVSTKKKYNRDKNEVK